MILDRNALGFFIAESFLIFFLELIFEMLNLWHYYAFTTIYIFAQNSAGLSICVPFFRTYGRCLNHILYFLTKINPFGQYVEVRKNRHVVAFLERVQLVIVGLAVRVNLGVRIGLEHTAHGPLTIYEATVSQTQMGHRVAQRTLYHKLLQVSDQAKYVKAAIDDNQVAEGGALKFISKQRTFSRHRPAPLVRTAGYCFVWHAPCLCKRIQCFVVREVVIAAVGEPAKAITYFAIPRRLLLPGHLLHTFYCVKGKVNLASRELFENAFSMRDSINGVVSLH